MLELAQIWQFQHKNGNFLRASCASFTYFPLCHHWPRGTDSVGYVESFSLLTHPQNHTKHHFILERAAFFCISSNVIRVSILMKNWHLPPEVGRCRMGVSVWFLVFGNNYLLNVEKSNKIGGYLFKICTSITSDTFTNKLMIFWWKMSPKTWYSDDSPNDFF